MDRISWRCDACNKRRMDGFIAVHKIVLGHYEDGMPIGHRNFKYCKDDATCFQVAKNWKPEGTEWNFN